MTDDLELRFLLSMRLLAAQGATLGAIIAVGSIGEQLARAQAWASEGSVEADVVICSECEREVPAVDAHLVLGDIYECDDCFERKRAEPSAGAEHAP